MARILVALHDIPVLSTRRNSLPALGWPQLSRIWQQSARVVWPATGVSLPQLIAKKQSGRTSLFDEATLQKLLVNDTINVVLTDEDLVNNQDQLFNLLSRHPYQQLKIYLLQTNDELTQNIKNHQILDKHLALVTPYDSRESLLHAPSPVWQTIETNGNDVIFYRGLDFPNITRQLGLRYQDIDQKLTEGAPDNLFVSPRWATRYPSAIAAPFLERLRLVGEESEQSAANNIVLVAENPKSMKYDDKLGLLLKQLGNQHQVLLTAIPRYQQARWWPLVAMHQSTDSPTHLDLNAGTVAQAEAVDFINDWLYQDKVAPTRLSTILTPIRAHSSVG